MKRTLDFSVCEEGKARLDALCPFPPETLKSLREYYRVGLTYTSNAIEGNSLTESETKVVIEDGLTVKGKPLRDVYEAVGHAQAYDHIHDLVSHAPLTEDDILGLHAMFYRQIDPSQAGCYRTIQVFISGSRHRLPVPTDVSVLMKDFMAWFNANEKTLHPVEFAARVHQRFVFIHPFVDGNGRLSRLLMNLALLRAGYTIAIIPPVLRGDYIAALEKAHADTLPFIDFIKDRVIETQNDILRMFGLSGGVNASGGGVNGGVNESGGGANGGLDRVLAFVRQSPGLNAKQISRQLEIPKRTLERYMQRLVFDKRIEFRGAAKNGGYFIRDR